MLSFIKGKEGTKRKGVTLKQVELGKGKNFDMSKVVDLYDEAEMLEEIDANNLILDVEKTEGDEDGEERE